MSGSSTENLATAEGAPELGWAISTRDRLLGLRIAALRAMIAAARAGAAPAPAGAGR